MTRKAKKEHNLPSTVYVYEEQDGDSTFLAAGRTQADLADATGARLVGTYCLINVNRVELRVKRTKVKR